MKWRVAKELEKGREEGVGKQPGDAVLNSEGVHEKWESGQSIVSWRARDSLYIYPRSGYIYILNVEFLSIWKREEKNPLKCSMSHSIAVSFPQQTNVEELRQNASITFHHPTWRQLRRNQYHFDWTCLEAKGYTLTTTTHTQSTLSSWCMLANRPNIHRILSVLIYWHQFRLHPHQFCK